MRDDQTTGDPGTVRHFLRRNSSTLRMVIGGLLLINGLASFLMLAISATRHPVPIPRGLIDVLLIISGLMLVIGALREPGRPAAPAAELPVIAATGQALPGAVPQRSPDELGNGQSQCGTARAPAERLRQLDQLLGQRLITDLEYRTRRAAIIAEL